MDGDRHQEASLPLKAYRAAGPTDSQPKIHYVGTSGTLIDLGAATQHRERLVEEFAHSAEEVAVLHLGGVVFTPGSLQELLLPLVRRLRAGEPRHLTLIVIAEDRGVADFVRMLAATHGLPLYVSERQESLGNAEPAGRLTPTEKETIDMLSALGGRTTVATFAQEHQMQVTAAGNRLNNLAERGYLRREQRSRRDGDQYIDPRHGL